MTGREWARDIAARAAAGIPGRAEAPPPAGPRRIRPTGDLYHTVLPNGAVYVGRPTRYGNPHPVGPKRCRVPGCAGVEHSSGAAVVAYRRHLRANPELVDRARVELAGRDLACWCAVSAPCHADVLLAVVAGEEP